VKARARARRIHEARTEKEDRAPPPPARRWWLPKLEEERERGGLKERGALITRSQLLRDLWEWRGEEGVGNCSR